MIEFFREKVQAKIMFEKKYFGVAFNKFLITVDGNM